MNKPLKQIKLTVQNDEDGEEFVIEDRGGGVEIRGFMKSPLQSGPSEGVTLPGGHCDNCPGHLDPIEQIGMSDDEWDDLRQWRNRKERKVTSKRMGEVLDKLIQGIGKAVKGFEECEGSEHSIVLKVESDG